MATRDQDVSVGTAEGVLVREGNYGTQVMTIEPGGAEFIPLNERHGRPVQLFWTWTSPNMEFATIFVGVLAVAGFGMGFWSAALALVLGSAIGAVVQGALNDGADRAAEDEGQRRGPEAHAEPCHREHADEDRSELHVRRGPGPEEQIGRAHV